MRRLFVVLVLFLSVLPAFGLNSFKDDKHTIELISGYETTGSLSAVTMGLHFTFDRHWKTYWHDTSLVGYPIKIDPSDSVNVKSVTISWPMPEQFTVLGLKSYGYSKEVVLPLTVVLKDPGKKADVNLKLDYLVCDPSHCLRRKITLDLPLMPQDQSGKLVAIKSQNFNLIKSYIDQIPRPDNGRDMTIERTEIDSSHADHYVLIVHARNSNGFTSPVLFIEPHAAMYIDFPEINLSSDKKTAVFTANIYSNELKKEIPATSLLNKKITVTLRDGNTAIEAARLVALPQSSLPQYLLILGFAFAGGFILNFMPCVLPVIFIKILSVFQHGGAHKSQIRWNFFLTVMGILSSFWMLAGLSIAFREFGYAIGWGIQFQEPLFLVAIMLVVTLFAFNLLGWFEILISSNIATKLTDIETRESQFSHFFSGAFVTLLATPCTAPFLGTALSYALSRGNIEIMEIFTLMGFGLALPFLMIGIFPELAQKLPKPGRWMLMFKKSLSILLFATLFWLLWTFSAIDGYVAAYSLLALYAIIGIFLYLKYKRSINPRISWSSVLVVSIVALFVPHFSGAHLHQKDLSGTAWEKYDEQKLETYVKQGRVVFVDVDADWCLTCKANEIFVLNSKEIETFFKQENAVEMVADWTNGDEKITAFLHRFGKYGVPFYVVFGQKYPDGLPLPEVLTLSIVENGVKATHN